MIQLPDTFPEAVGLALKEWRERKGLTQVQAADRAQVSQPAFSRFERGMVCPSLEVVHRLMGTDGAAALLRRAGKFMAARRAAEEIE